ncbi:required for excision 1-B domain-containing protein-like isoform X1 [Dermacentor andersoni]|uniref:required for excision 1-B domain-containing protein-like isoform X1 n=1 Tax=Dermacentor andersoni TaxID=34620 RepID=UPI0024172479|nr:required for excision 1-B domain-containing protein-like isoform X1 [Dermacentor andersoni]
MIATEHRSRAVIKQQVCCVFTFLVKESNVPNPSTLQELTNIKQLFKKCSAQIAMFLMGHKIYLSTAPNYDFPTFRELVREVTQEFKRISEGMMDIERRLRLNDNSGHLAEYVRALQEEEKVKLELTAKLQLAKQDLLDNPEEYKNQADVASMKARLTEVVERINDNLMELKYEMNGMFAC